MARDNDELKRENDSKPHAGSLSPGGDASLANGAVAGPSQDPGDLQQLDPAVLEKIIGMSSRIHEAFGKVALAFAASPRHRNL